MRAAGKAYLASFYLRNGKERDTTTTTSNDKTTPPRLCTSRAWAAGARPVGLARAVPFHFHPLDSIGAIELVDRYGVRRSSTQRSTVCYCTPTDTTTMWRAPMAIHGRHKHFFHAFASVTGIRPTPAGVSHERPGDSPHQIQLLDSTRFSSRVRSAAASIRTTSKTVDFPPKKRLIRKIAR